MIGVEVGIDPVRVVGFVPVRVVGFVHDGGSNIKLSGQILHEKYGWFSLSCAVHNIMTHDSGP